MSISIGRYIQQGYTHPGSLGHDMYHPYPQHIRYTDPGSGQYMEYHSWMINAPNEMAVTPESYFSMGTPSPTDGQTIVTPFYNESMTGITGGVRNVKRRVTASKKERRRTQNINNAFASLRGCIPNVPADTKLSKIKTLRLACRYISYLMDLLSKNDPQLADEGFKADISKKIAKAVQEEEDIRAELEMDKSPEKEECKSKSRTGWPQEVWASELKQEIQQDVWSTDVKTELPQEQ